MGACARHLDASGSLALPLGHMAHHRIHTYPQIAAQIAAQISPQKTEKMKELIKYLEDLQTTIPDGKDMELLQHLEKQIQRAEEVEAELMMLRITLQDLKDIRRGLLLCFSTKELNRATEAGRKERLKISSKEG